MEQRSPYSLRSVNGRFLRLHCDTLKDLLNRDEARANRLDVLGFAAFIDELIESWNGDTNMACCVVNKTDDQETPLAIAIASKRVYREGGRRVMELNWERT